MLKFYTLIIALLLSSTVIAQKRLEKSFDATGIDNIIVEGNGIYTITITTAQVNVITLKATIQGETFENLLITEKQKLGTITFSLEYSPFFKPENDKLAAHKVVAVELFLEVPENKTVKVNSDLALFKGSGRFKEIEVSLKQRDCYLSNFLGNGVFQTLKGDIIIEALSEVSGTAKTQKGSVINTLKKHQKFKISAESKHGNIHLSQTK